MKRLFLTIITILLALATAPLSAAPTYFTDRAAFDAATGGGLDFESFEGNFPTSDTIAFPGFTVSETLGANILGQLRDFPGLVDGALTDGTGALIYDDNDNSIGTFFSFVNPVTAFGLDIATNPGSTVTIGGSAIDTTLVLGNDTASFWGVVDNDGLTSITFDASGGPNVGFDAASYGLAMIEVAIDIKFCSNPNAHNCRSGGVLPVTIFGAADLDVADIDLASLQLCRADGWGCTPLGSAIDSKTADRGRPDDRGTSACERIDTDGDGVPDLDVMNPDGFVDLDAAFDKFAVSDLLDVCADGLKGDSSVALFIQGSLLDGTPIFSTPVGTDGIDQLVRKNR